MLLSCHQNPIVNKSPGLRMFLTVPEEDKMINFVVGPCLVWWKCFWATYLEETFTAFTGTDSIVLTGCIVTTNCTSALIGSWVLRFRRCHGLLHCLWAFQGSMLQGHWGAMKWRDMLLRGQEERVVLAWLTILMVPKWRVMLWSRAEGEKRELLGHSSFINSRGWGRWGVGAERGIPDRCRVSLKSGCCGRSCSINWAGIVLRVTWWKHFIKATQRKGPWVTTIHLEIIQFEGLALHLRAGIFSYCSMTKSSCRGRRGGGDLAGISIKLPCVAISHQGVDARQWRHRHRQLVLLATDVHHQFGTEVRIQKLRVEAGVIG